MRALGPWLDAEPIEDLERRAELRTRIDSPALPAETLAVREPDAATIERPCAFGVP